MTKLEIALKSFNQLQNEFTGHDYARLCKKNGLEKVIKNVSTRINFRTEFCKQYANKSSLKTWRKKEHMPNQFFHLINFEKEINPQIKFESEDMIKPKKQEDAVSILLDIAKNLKNNNDRVVLINAALMIIENDK